MLGEREVALSAFEALAERYPERDEGSAGLYWAGRLDARSGATARANARWRTLIAATPHSYYALAAAQRLGESPWTPDSIGPEIIVPAETMAALARAALLDSIGFVPEQLLELDHLASRAGRTPSDLVVAATALALAGHTSRSVGLAQRALAADAPRTRQLYLLLFPIPEPAVFPALAPPGNSTPGSPPDSSSRSQASTLEPVPPRMRAD